MRRLILGFTGGTYDMVGKRMHWLKYQLCGFGYSKIYSKIQNILLFVIVSLDMSRA